MEEERRVQEAEERGKVRARVERVSLITTLFSLDCS